jgi:hypothetical protein
MLARHMDTQTRPSFGTNFGECSKTSKRTSPRTGGLFCFHSVSRIIHFTNYATYVTISATYGRTLPQQTRSIQKAAQNVPELSRPSLTARTRY